MRKVVLKKMDKRCLGCILQIIVCAGVPTIVSVGQAGPANDKPAYAADQNNVPDAVAKVKSGNFAAVHLQVIANAKATEAIPALANQFERGEDSLQKTMIASTLIRLGEQDSSYWDYLVQSARRAIMSDAPSYWEFDQQGKVASGPSPKFMNWVKAHNMSVDAASKDVTLTLPGTMAMLGQTGDPRAIPLLRMGLNSANFMIENQSARGLAEIGDKDSIPLIVKASRLAPSDFAKEIAGWLVYFDDGDAQAAVEEYVPKETAKISREARASGKTPYR